MTVQKGCCDGLKRHCDGRKQHLLHKKNRLLQLAFLRHNFFRAAKLSISISFPNRSQPTQSTPVPPTSPTCPVSSTGPYEDRGSGTVHSNVMLVANGDRYYSLGCRPTGRNPRKGGRIHTLPEREPQQPSPLSVPFRDENTRLIAPRVPLAPLAIP